MLALNSDVSIDCPVFSICHGDVDVCNARASLPLLEIEIYSAGLLILGSMALILIEPETRPSPIMPCLVLS